MKISIGFSPCPNDTYVFDAMVNHLIDTDGLEFDLFIEDVETLNEWTIEGRLDVTKLSFPALFAAKTVHAFFRDRTSRFIGPFTVGGIDSREPIYLRG